MAAFTTVDCPTWAALVEEFNKLKGWIFRGHASAKWTLKNTLERRTPPGESRSVFERFVVHQFKRRAHHYLASHHLPKKDGDWIALMQHFGAPTRLLDFTRSPFVAAYFAFEELPSDNSSHCAIVA